MSSTVVVQNLTKHYKIYPGPRALFKELFFRKPSHAILSALEDVSFEVARGEAFGVVGNNGAGKSTLLKILTGTAFPTHGSIEVQGRIASLLELGAGFHPEFTGRKNIYFNGAIMGLSPEEIRAREQAIIDFSELGEQIDQVVRTYSSGMYLRLGFSVATSFDSDILIIDEALSVGDKSFQKKCTDRVLDFKRSGGTILFCSHNLYQVKGLCERALWLERGRVKALGPSDIVVEDYNASVREGIPDRVPEPSKKSSVCWVAEVKLERPPEDNGDFQYGDDITLSIVAHFSPEFKGEPGIGVALVRNDGLVVYTTATTLEGSRLEKLGDDHYRAKICFPRIQLLPGYYHFNIVTTDEDALQAYDIVENAEPFFIRSEARDFGVCRLEHAWLHLS